jgi:hypothetical protein
MFRSIEYYLAVNDIFISLSSYDLVALLRTLNVSIILVQETITRLHIAITLTRFIRRFKVSVADAYRYQ